MERINEEMDKELARKEKKNVELERRVQEAEVKRIPVEAKYEAALQEQIRMRIRIRDILNNKVIQLPEEEEEPDDKSTTTKEWNLEKEVEGPKSIDPLKTGLGFESSSSSSEDETNRIEKEVVNFLKNTKAINEEKGHKIKRYLKTYLVNMYLWIRRKTV